MVPGFAKYRRRLMNFAFISSVANFARGVGNKAESAFAYFGSTLSVTGRKRIMAKITGDDANGRATNNTNTQAKSNHASSDCYRN